MTTTRLSTTLTLALLVSACIPCHALTVKEATDQLVRELSGPNPPGQVLFSEDFESGALDAWTADTGWSVAPDPAGGDNKVGRKVGRVVSDSTDIMDLILKQKLPAAPGHPIAVCWRARFESGATPGFLRVDFFDDTGTTGDPYARQDTAAQGAEWTPNVKLVSDWFPAYTRQFAVWFHQGTDTPTVTLVDDIRVVDLGPAVQALLAAEMPRCRALADRLEADATALPASALNDAWKAVVQRSVTRARQDLDASAAIPPGTPEADAPLQRAAGLLSRLTEVVAGLQAGTTTSARLLTYTLSPLTSTPVLPTSGDLPGQAGSRLALTATPGERESGSFVVWAPEALPELLVTPTDLYGPGGSTLPAASVDLKWVKCWYQAGSAWWGVGQDRAHRLLVPELLLKDDALVQVDLDQRRTSLKLSFPEGPQYVPVDDPTSVRWGTCYPAEDYPVRDSATLQPTDVPAQQNKQVWVTVTLPAGTAPGRYEGDLVLTCQAREVGRLKLALEVLPFTLPAPATHHDAGRGFTYSLYYWGQMDPQGKARIGLRDKSAQQLGAELRYMAEHNIVAPTVIWSAPMIYENEEQFRQHLQIAQDAGCAGRPLYFGSSDVIGNPTDPAALELLTRNVKRTIALAHEYGFTDVYFYGMDEATGDRLLSQKAAWKAVQDAGGKVIVSGFQGQFEAVGGLLDLFNRCGDPALDNAARWHDKGALIWNYANPQSPPENPELFRRNLGLYLWKLDYDGACTYCLMDQAWNDFADDSYRAHNLAYPTVDGVVETIAMVGMREGADDVRYATELRTRIAAARQSGDAGLAQRADEANAWLEGLDTRQINLEETRREMVRLILGLG
jgi:hypothetical protein